MRLLTSCSLGFLMLLFFKFFSFYIVIVQYPIFIKIGFQWDDIIITRFIFVSIFKSEINFTFNIIYARISLLSNFAFA